MRPRACQTDPPVALGPLPRAQVAGGLLGSRGGTALRPCSRAGLGGAGGAWPAAPSGKPAVWAKTAGTASPWAVGPREGPRLGRDKARGGVAGTGHGAEVACPQRGPAWLPAPRRPHPCVPGEGTRTPVRYCTRGGAARPQMAFVTGAASGPGHRPPVGGTVTLSSRTRARSTWGPGCLRQASLPRCHWYPRRRNSTPGTPALLPLGESCRRAAV